MAIVSGGTRSNVTAELKAIGLLHYFKIILTADDPIAPKPAPDIFYEAATRLKVPPEHCLVFEDGELGIQAAVAAGMKTIDVNQLLISTLGCD